MLDDFSQSAYDEAYTFQARPWPKLNAAEDIGMNTSPSRCSLVVAVGSGCLLSFVLWTISTPALAQRPPSQAGDKAKGAEPPKKAAAPAPEGNQDDKEKYQIVALQTEDGMLINATYFPSKAGKSAPAVILVHGWGEKQRVFDDLAFDLQDRGYAVVTLDLRGHGKSTEWANAPKVATKAAEKPDFRNLRTPAQLITLLYDIEAAKRFLVRRNNAGELNVAKLGVIGTEMGSSIAILWSFKDWQYVSTVAFTGKQGQDVQSLVLISPQYNYKGLAITEQLSFLQQRIPLLVVAGNKDPKMFGEAEKIAKAAVKAAPKADVPSELFEVTTKFQGSKLLDTDPELAFGVNKSIIKFLDASLKKKAIPWATREISESDAATGQ